MSKSRPIQPTATKPFLAIAVLFTITFLAYLPALRGGFIWDDDSYVQRNPTLRSLSGLWAIWAHTSATPQYYPLVHTSFWIEYHFWGASDSAALGYKIVNLLLHITSALLLWRLLRFLKFPGAYLAAAVFAVHPVNVESVTWITERKNVLSGVFYLLAFQTYLTALGENGDWNDEPKAFCPRSYFLALLFFLLALLSKTVTATFPAAVLLILWWKRGRLCLRDFLRLIPFFLIGIAMGSLTGYLERTQVGAHGPEWAVLTPLDRILIAGRAVCFYAGKILLPIHLSFIYPRWTINPHELWQFAFPVAVVIVVLTLYLFRHRITRGPLTAILFSIGTLFPALGFANVYPMRYSFVADHFQYLAGIGLICPFVAILYSLIKPKPQRVIIAVVLVLTLTTITFARGFAYENRETLWRDTLSKNPDSWMAHTNLGHALHAKGDDVGAKAQYQAALEDAPNVADTHLNAAISRAIAGDFDGAIGECRRAIELNPTFADAYANLAKAYLSKGDYTQAQTIARQGIAISPNHPLSHYVRARALELSNQLSQAANEYQAALSTNPDDAEAHFHLANILVQLHQGQAAIEHYQATVAIDPKNKFAWTTLGDLLLATGKPDDARNCFHRALNLDPTFNPARNGLNSIGVQ